MGGPETRRSPNVCPGYSCGLYSSWTTSARRVGADDGQLTLDDDEIGLPDVLDHVAQPGAEWSQSVYSLT
jgi:hypothetical protein